MSNTNKVIDMIAKEALRVAHEKATFIGSINRSYDDSFAKSGAKIGCARRHRWCSKTCSLFWTIAGGAIALACRQRRRMNWRHGLTFAVKSRVTSAKHWSICPARYLNGA